MIDLDAYFARIGYHGPREANLEVLRALHALHPDAIPFENIDPLLGQPVEIDIASVQAKLVGRRRGGYCFEHNTLFQEVLIALGFAVTCLAGRVMWMVPRDLPPTPRGHMLLQIDLEGRAYLVDVGFGGQLFTSPMPLVPDDIHADQTSTRRLIPADGALILQTQFGGEWHNVYRFTREPCFASDYMVANWFTWTFPQSLFRNNLMMMRQTATIGTSLLNRRLRRRHADGWLEETILADAAALQLVLIEEFRIEPPVDVATLFARLPAES